MDNPAMHRPKCRPKLSTRQSVGYPCRRAALAGVSKMKVRMIALAGASLLALTVTATAQMSGGATSSAPAAPPMQPAPPPPPPPAPPPPAPAPEWMTQGWYVSLGACWDHMRPVEYTVGGLGNFTYNT